MVLTYYDIQVHMYWYRQTLVFTNISNLFIYCCCSNLDETDTLKNIRLCCNEYLLYTDSDIVSPDWDQSMSFFSFFEIRSTRSNNGTITYESINIYIYIWYDACNKTHLHIDNLDNNIIPRLAEITLVIFLLSFDTVHYFFYFKKHAFIR